MSTMAEGQMDTGKEDFPWHLGVYDAHCHPTDTVSSISKIPGMKTKALTIMATRAQDQTLVADFGEKLGLTKQSLLESEGQGHLVPAFGWHPWFSHQIYDDLLSKSEKGHAPSTKIAHYTSVIVPPPDDEEFIDSLPEPRPLSALLDGIRSHLEQYPISLVGEIGLDRAFRIPGTEVLSNDFQADPLLTPGGREGRRLSPYRVDLDHQRRILTTQLSLAGQLQRAVSVHGVAAHGVVYDTLRDTWRGHERSFLSKRARKRGASAGTAHVQDDIEAENEAQRSDKASALPFPPRICLHSYSGPPDTLKQYLHPSVPATIFFSFSHLVNFSNSSKKAIDVIMAVPDDRILAESDLHAAGEQMDDLIEEIVRRICQIKGWSLEEGVKQLASNWMRYILGDTNG